MSENGIAPIATGDDVRHAWWPIRGLIVALDLLKEHDGRDADNAKSSIVTALLEAAQRFSPLVEAVADGTPEAKP